MAVAHAVNNTQYEIRSIHFIVSEYTKVMLNFRHDLPRTHPQVRTSA